MKVRRLIHKGWEEWNTKMPMKLRKQSMFGEEGWAGKYQYIYSSDKGEISLVKLKVGGMDKPFWMWEIMEISAKKLFKDVERFSTKKESEIRIRGLLE